MNFNSFKEFYPYYLQEHSNKTCRLLHFIGTMLVIFIAAFSIYTKQYVYLWTLPLAGYSFAWIGHFVFEKNKPATFKYPFYSLTADFVMVFDIWRGKVKIF